MDQGDQFLLSQFVRDWRLHALKIEGLKAFDMAKHE